MLLKLKGISKKRTIILIKSWRQIGRRKFKLAEAWRSSEKKAKYDQYGHQLLMAQEVLRWWRSRWYEYG
jgi:hypothetical protein